MLRGSLVKLKAHLPGYKCTKMKIKIIGNDLSSRPILAPLRSGLGQDPNADSRFVFMVLAAPTVKYYSDALGDLTVDVEEEDLRDGDVHLKFFFETSAMGKNLHKLLLSLSKI